MKRYVIIFIFISLNTFIFPKVWKSANAEVVYSTIFTKVGQVLEFNIRLKYSNNLKFSSITTNSNSGDFNIHFNDKINVYTNKSDNTVSLIKKGKIQIFEIEDFDFKGFNLTVTNKKTKIEYKNIGQCRIFVTPPMIDSKKKPLILDIKGPMEKPSSFPYWLLIIAITVVIGIIIYLLKNKTVITQLPGLGDDEDLWVTIEKRMNAIEAMDISGDESLKEYFIAITDTIKIFLTGRSGIHFLELTTFEISQNLSGIQWLSDEKSKNLMQFFTEADMVKFAKEVPGEDDLKNYFLTIYDWLKFVNNKYLSIQEIMESENNLE